MKSLLYVPKMLQAWSKFHLLYSKWIPLQKPLINFDILLFPMPWKVDSDKFDIYILPGRRTYLNFTRTKNYKQCTTSVITYGYKTFTFTNISSNKLRVCKESGKDHSISRRDRVQNKVIRTNTKTMDIIRWKRSTHLPQKFGLYNLNWNCELYRLHIETTKDYLIYTNLE